MQSPYEHPAVQRRTGPGALCVMIVLLGSCGTPPVAYADYCAELGRPLSKPERFTAALLFAYPQAEQHTLNHFAAFRERYIAAHRGASPPEVVRAYLQRYPDCCAVVEPWPVRTYDNGLVFDWRPNWSAEQAFADWTSEGFRWSHDVVIIPNGTPDPSFHVSFEQSDCGRTSRGSRG